MEARPVHLDQGALCISRSKSHIFPVSAVLTYLSILPPVPGSLFLNDDGTPLTCSDPIAAVQLSPYPKAMTNISLLAGLDV